MSFGLHRSSSGSLSDRSEQRERDGHSGGGSHHHSNSLSSVPPGLFDNNVGVSGSGAIAGRRQVSSRAAGAVGSGSASAGASSSSYLPKLDSGTGAGSAPSSSSSSSQSSKLYAYSSEPPAHAHARKFKLSQRSQLPSADVLRSETNAIKAAAAAAQQPLMLDMGILGGGGGGGAGSAGHSRLRSLSTGTQPALFGLKPSPRDHRK